MPSSALRSLAETLNPSAAKNGGVRVPALIVSAAVTLSHAPGWRSQKVERHGVRHYASDNVSNSEQGPASAHTDNDLPIEAKRLFSSPRRRDLSAWTALIELYLPLRLRLGSQSTEGEATQYSSLLPIQTLPLVLSKARTNSKVDLLSYLGVCQERWEAVIWLVKTMLETPSGQLLLESKPRQLTNLLWPASGQSLDQVTEEAIQVEFPPPSKLRLDQIASSFDLRYADRAVSKGHRSLGQVWQSLGIMILRAADRSADDPSYSVIMSRVFQILAHLHHISAFPDSIYNYSPATDPTVLQRPPTLYILSRRIMSTLSDVAWGVQWEGEISKALSQGYDLPKVTLQPKIREFGPELWLDLILWACIEGGWIKEGAWIVGEMERRKDDRDTQWSAVSWEEICEVQTPKLDLTSILRQQIERTRVRQVGGIGIAAGTSSTVDMGTRTISREVVLALIDGLANLPHSLGTSYRPSPVEVQRDIRACKDLLERGQLNIDTNFLNATILRLLESAGADTKASPHVLERVINLRSTDLSDTKRSTESSLSAQDYDTDDSAGIIGLLHRNLHSYAHRGNLLRSLTTFRKIQNVVDVKQKQCIQDFADELRIRGRQEDEATDLIGSEESASGPVFHPKIPVSTLVVFLDLLTTSRFFDLGKWLLSSDEVEGGALDPVLYSERNLQPALLRFATATADDDLLSKILQSLEAPLSEPVLHALFRCEIALGKWNAIEALLEHFKKTPGMSWKASDAMAIARAILQMEHAPLGTNDSKSISQAHQILQDLIRGRYNSDRDPSQLPDLFQIRLANQLGRIFRALPGSLNNIKSHVVGSVKRAHSGVDITPNSFNLLLETVVECRGSVAGKDLWEKWCRPPSRSESIKQTRSRLRHIRSPALDPDDDGLERIVTPTLYMLRNVLRPVLRSKRYSQPVKTQSEGLSSPDPEDLDQPAGREEIQDATNVRNQGSLASSTLGSLSNRDEENGILEWGISMYEKFGLSEEEINAEIPGSFPRLQQAEPPIDTSVAAS
ncbi:hypothetical protein MMC28_002310 [Mycoblastus sanguinarius]|nr:hypothetical protein [Mycoblastus sanguinarius]